MSKLRFVIPIVLTVFGLLIAVGTSASASTSGTTVANVTVNNTLSLSAVSASFALSGDPGTTQGGNGIVSYTLTTNDASGAHVDMSSTPNFASTGTHGTNPDTFPTSTLQYRQENNGAIMPTNGASFASVPVNGTIANMAAAGSNVGAIDFQIVIPSTVRPDTYATTLTLTAFAN